LCARHGRECPLSPKSVTSFGQAGHLAFDGGRQTSDVGVLVLAAIERRHSIAERRARCMPIPG